MDYILKKKLDDECYNSYEEVNKFFILDKEKDLEDINGSV